MLQFQILDPPLQPRLISLFHEVRLEQLEQLELQDLKVLRVLRVPQVQQQLLL